MKIPHLLRPLGALFILFLFSSHVLAGLPPVGCPSQASEPHEPDQRNLVSGPSVSAPLGEQRKKFIKDTRLTLELGQVWEVNDGRDIGYKRHGEEYAQLVTLDLSSGMFMGLFGADAVLFGVMPLKHEGPSEGSVFFQNGTDGYVKSALAMKLSPFKGMMVKAGTMESPHLLLGPGDYRTTPRLYRAETVTYTWSDLTLSYVHATGVSDYTRQSFDDFIVNKGSFSAPDLMDRPVQVADITWDRAPVYLNAAFARQRDFMEYTFAEASVTWPKIGPFTLRTDVNYRLKNSLREIHGDLDHKMQMVSGRAILGIGRAWLSIAASSVEDNTEFGNSIDGTIGARWWSSEGILAGCREGGYYTNGVQGTFNHQGEDAYKIEAGYALPGALDGLTLSAYYIQGQDIYAGNEYIENQRQREWGGRISYAPPQIKGLSMEVIHGTNTQKSDGDYGMDQVLARTQVSLNYRINLL